MALYDIYRIGPDPVFADVHAMNNNGTVVGYIAGGKPGLNGYRWRNSVLTELVPPGPISSDEHAIWALDVNDHEVIVGSHWKGGGAFTWQNGSWSPIDVLTKLGDPTFTSCLALAINKSGVITGRVTTDAGDNRAFILDAAGARLLDAFELFGQTQDYAMDINDQGIVFGVGAAPIGSNYTNIRCVPLAWTADGAWIQLDDSPDPSAPNQRACNLRRANNLGVAVGSVTFSGAYPQLLLPPSSSAAVWTLSPPAHYLLPYPGTNSQCAAADINIHGQIVGWANYDQFAGNPYATLWNGSVITRLNDLVDPSLGWSLDSASAINDHGQIAGVGSINGKAASWFMTPHLEVRHAGIPLQFLQILFGIRNDTPGVLRRPGGGIGPGPGGPGPMAKFLERMPQPYRNVVLQLLEEQQRH